MNLGRFQPGQTVNIAVSTVDGDGNPAMPDAAPIATITAPDSTVLFAGKIALTATPFLFSLPIFVGIPYSVGTYQVEYQWLVAGVSVNASDTFDVIHGGDAGGRIIAMYAYDRPEASYVVAQLTSGNVVQGRNPRL